MFVVLQEGGEDAVLCEEGAQLVGRDDQTRLDVGHAADHAHQVVVGLYAGRRLQSCALCYRRDVGRHVVAVGGRCPSVDDLTDRAAAPQADVVGNEAAGGAVAVGHVGKLFEGVVGRQAVGHLAPPGRRAAPDVQRVVVTLTAGCLHAVVFHDHV